MNKHSMIPKIYIKIKTEVAQIMVELNMNPDDEQRSFRWLKELIFLAVYHPNNWQDNYLEDIGKREGLTRERVRQILYKAVWNNWNASSKDILERHFGYSIQTKFRHVKPNHIEFITLISNELRKRHNYG